ncbi:portal and MuF-like fusion protein [Microbacterium phage Lahqtemish]|uniref:portal and MuF-like fusion protein n=1 Tax=Microbacterium phage Lahqtemish TaxID=2776867 RepID=UPI0018A591A3|nr:portal and MuF-like fusion protein [Microbacterium phage Lahqtemish]QOP66596.1 portal and MuF-like fusion protein [Microbacterium phage Lahqtemish]
MPSFIERAKAAVSVALFGTAPWLPSDTAALQAGDPSIVFGAGFATEVVDGMSVGDLYQTQPNLRSVVDFTSRNAAQLGRHVFRPDGKGGRERARDSFMETLLQNPNDYQTGYDLFKQLFSELALYDFHLWVIDYSRKGGGTTITGIPTEWITGTKADAFGRVTKYRVQPNGSNEWFYVDVEDAVVFRGYNPHGFKKGSSPVASLRNTLSEQIAAGDFRRQMWKRGGRIGMYLTRPADAPEWSAEGKAKFIQQWKAQWSGGGAEAGGTPLLDEGMEMKRVGFNAREEQWLEGAQLALVTVAQAFHVPPAMLGAPGYNSFASVKEFRKMLYTETLGPSVAQVEDTINRFLAPLIGINDGSYLELNIGEKLQGDFEEQAAVTSTAVGGPWMTVNEARAKANLPAIEGGDELLAPLNMGAAGNNGPMAGTPIGTSPSGDPDPAAPGKESPKPHDATHGLRADGYKAPDPKAAALEADLEAFFAAQRQVILAKLGQKGPSWFDQKHWNQELSAILTPHLTAISTGTARRVAGAKGLNPADYSVARTEKFLKAVADSRADLINATTRDHYQNAIDNGTDPTLVYEDSESRSKTVGSTIATFITAWAVVEVAKQLMPDKKPTKTWLASGLPNSRHADMDGETVDIDEKFSNGAMWPGDPVLGAEGVANCGCGVDISEGGS